MLLKCFVFTLKIKVSVHQGLVGVVDSFQISVLATFINFQAVELSLKTLQLSSKFMSSIVFLTVLLQSHLLFIDKSRIELLKLIDLQI